eukprot:PhF_6_TR24697/c0_g1_i1/m.33912
MRVSPNKLYHYQEHDIEKIFNMLDASTHPHILYQLPTGGGKTRVFSEIARRYIDLFGKTVTVLTHRRELCTQTSAALKGIGVKNSRITATGRDIKPGCRCYVAMVETLRNRIKSGKIKTAGVG